MRVGLIGCGLPDPASDCLDLGDRHGDVPDLAIGSISAAAQPHMDALMRQGRLGP